MMKSALVTVAAAASAQAYFLVSVGTLFRDPQRVDPIVAPGGYSVHAHKILGGSNFANTFDGSAKLREAECTTMPIKEDKSNYWFPQLYFEWANGSVSEVGGNAVTYYLYPDTAGTTTPFPEDFRMISGDPAKRTYDENDAASQAVSFLCLNYTPGGPGTSRHTKIPDPTGCPDGIRFQLNYPSCWNGKDSDSDDHKSHVAYRSGGPDSGDCTDPDYPKSIPRIFSEMYYGTQDFTDYYAQAKNPGQPFILSNGDRVGYSYHGDFMNGWKADTLQRVVDECNCNIYGDATCCAQKGIFTLETTSTCRKTSLIDEPTSGLLDSLPGYSQAQGDAEPKPNGQTPSLLSPALVYTDEKYPEADYVPVAITGGQATTPSAPASSAAASGAASSVAPAASSAVASSVLAASSVAAAASSAAPAASSPGDVYVAVSSSAAQASATSSAPAESETEPTCDSNNNTHHGHHQRRARMHRRGDYSSGTF